MISGRPSGVVLVEGEKWQVAWFVPHVPKDAPIVDAGGGSVSEAYFPVAQGHHLAV